MGTSEAAVEDHARVTAQLRSDALYQRKIAGQLVADVMAVEIAQQRGLLAEARRQPVDERAVQIDRLAAGERVGQAVAVVVDRVLALPGQGRQNHQHVRGGAAALGVRDHRDGRLLDTGAERELVQPGTLAGITKRSGSGACACRT